MKKKNKHADIVLLAKTILNNIEVLIYEMLTDSYVSHDESVSINNLIMKFYENQKS